MTVFAAPLIIDAHLQWLPTLDGWDTVAVYGGPLPGRADVRRWATIGHLDGDDGPAVHLDPTHDGQRQNYEAGSIACGLYVAGADFPAARAAVFDLLTPWSGWLQRQPTLPDLDGGAARLLPGSSLALAADVTLTQTRAGATATAVVTITYTAVTYG